MLIVGELLNGTRAAVGQAVVARDAAFVQDIARRQAEAGAHYIDLNTGQPPDREPEDMAWMVETVQSVVETPLSIDTPNPVATEVGLRHHKNGQPLINSVSGEGDRAETVLPLVKQYNARVVILTIEDAGIPYDVENRVRIAKDLVKRTDEHGIPRDHLYLDPAVFPVGAVMDTPIGVVILEAIRRFRQEIPGIHVIGGFSNVSFGMPNRRLLNQTFVIMALASGLDAAIIDPLDRGLRAMIYAARFLLDQDPLAAEYIGAYRQGLLKVAS